MRTPAELPKLTYLELIVAEHAPDYSFIYVSQVFRFSLCLEQHGKRVRQKLRKGNS
jgi:hypothetical protein